MSRRRPEHATMYDFRDLDLMFKIAENSNGDGIPANELADLLGFDDGDNRPVGIRLAWMRRYGMVAYDDRAKTWKLSEGGERVTRAHLRAPALRTVEKLPDEAFVEVMAHVTSRYHRGDALLGHMLRREFLYGTKRR
jgi:hypothetical protein